MTDRRLTPMNSRVAAAHLPGIPAGVEPVAGRPARVAVPVAGLLRAPDGARDRQVLYGASVTVYETRDGWAFIQSASDGYVGYLRAEMLAEPLDPTHWVSAPATHAYTAADFKSPDTAALSFGSRVAVSGTEGRFAKTELGYIPAVHLTPAGGLLQDPVEVAEGFLGTPYLWGGNSRWGIDCSGLVQAALAACGKACPGDSDMQEADLGALLPQGTGVRRGDLLFWKGHVALVRDPDTIVHANAHHMAVAIEPLQPAIERILAQGDGPVTAHRRIP